MFVSWRTNDSHTHTHTHTIEPEAPVGVIEVGTNISKQFVGESGKIIGLFRGYECDVGEDDDCDGSVLYSVIYEDGDTEDMNEKECLECIELKGN